MRLQKLRTEAPGWTWRAGRSGMGWRYFGTKDGRTVEVYAVAVLGQFDDGSETQWRVEDKDAGVSMDYASWWLCNASDPTPTATEREEK